MLWLMLPYFPMHYAFTRSNAPVQDTADRDIKSWDMDHTKAYVHSQACKMIERTNHLHSSSCKQPCTESRCCGRRAKGLGISNRGLPFMASERYLHLDSGHGRGCYLWRSGSRSCRSTQSLGLAPSPGRIVSTSTSSLPSSLTPAAACCMLHLHGDGRTARARR